ncbi:MerR family DNA-binding transcriptional regulator [Streptomyces decoyicus]|uniref:MerR family DNA-binding transcriptional regulator n=1 Tax=Streptomyces decoyicus TaxID=249567 RepID=UPI0036314234
MSHITWTIGELAARTGLSVKTIRYYSAIGLLPLTGRSAGGHRRYAHEAADSLTCTRALGGCHHRPGSCGATAKPIAPARTRLCRTARPHHTAELPRVLDSSLRTGQGFAVLRTQ